MNFLFNLSGANTPLIKEYDIAPDTEITHGDVVGIVDGLVGKTAVGSSVIGVAAEDHTGEKDILNARSDGDKIRVDITDGAVYSAKAPVYKVKSTSSSNTAIAVSSVGLSSSISSGYLVLRHKADDSENTDNVGDARKVSACNISGQTATFTVSAGGTAYKDDEYVFMPEIGSDVYLDSTARGIAAYNSASTVKFIVVCKDDKAFTVGVKLKTTLFD